MTQSDKEKIASLSTSMKYTESEIGEIKLELKEMNKNIAGIGESLAKLTNILPRIECLEKSQEETKKEIQKTKEKQAYFAGGLGVFFFILEFFSDSIKSIFS